LKSEYEVQVAAFLACADRGTLMLQIFSEVFSKEGTFSKKSWQKRRERFPKAVGRIFEGRGTQAFISPDLTQNANLFNQTGSIRVMFF